MNVAQTGAAKQPAVSWGPIGRPCHVTEVIADGLCSALNVCAAAAGVVDSFRPMDKTLQVLNGLERDGVILRYAIGGAMAATFYAEPVLTFDLDIFVLLPRTAG